ncbi:MAG: prephenate dehydratase [Candidatus Nanopelagicaceae bacterium]
MSKYAYLGPVGTFTEAALRTITGGSDQLTPCSNVTAALDMVRSGQADFALVPIENSVEGVVARTLDELAIGEPLIIVGEILLPVTFALMVKDKSVEIKKIATHPHAESQCRKFIAKHYPNAEIISTNSTAAAAEALANGQFDAAVASEVAAKTYGLTVINNNIGDAEAAVTRFVLVSKPVALPEPTGFDRTSLAAFIGIDHAGALLEVLTEFAMRGVNLTFIQSRPTGRELGHYHFIIDAEGHVNDARVGDALTGLRRICEDIRFLGSYPRADKVAPTTTKSSSDDAFKSSNDWLNEVRKGRAI